MISYECPHCQERLSVSEDRVGSTYVCPNCDRGNRVPAEPLHRARLLELKALKRQRHLTALELGDVAEHLRALGKHDKADEALAAARRQREREQAAAAGTAVAEPSTEEFDFDADAGVPVPPPPDLPSPATEVVLGAIVPIVGAIRGILFLGRPSLRMRVSAAYSFGGALLGTALLWPLVFGLAYWIWSSGRPEAPAAPLPEAAVPQPALPPTPAPPADVRSRPAQAPPAVAEAVAVTYRLTGDDDAQRVGVRYYTETGGVEEETVTLPWTSRTFTVQPPGAVLRVELTAPQPGGEVQAQILVNNQVWQSTTAAGQPASVGGYYTISAGR